MTDKPIKPVPTTPTKDVHAKRPTIKNADVPSDTVGLPGVGDGASAAHFARDTVQGQQNDGSEESHSHAPADPRDRPDG